MPVFHAFVLLLIMDFIITLSIENSCVYTSLSWAKWTASDQVCSLIHTLSCEESFSLLWIACLYCHSKQATQMSSLEAFTCTSDIDNQKVFLISHVFCLLDFFLAYRIYSNIEQFIRHSVVTLVELNTLFSTAGCKPWVISASQVAGTVY